MLAISGAAEAQVIRIGDIILTADGGFTPTRLPKHENAPITIHGGGKVSTVSGAYPPILENINIEFDRHGSVETTGLPACSQPSSEATTVPRGPQGLPRGDRRRGLRARGRRLPRKPTDQRRLADHPLQRAQEGRQPDRPRPRLHHRSGRDDPDRPGRDRKNPQGVYGYRTKAKIPKIAGGAGIPISGQLTIGKKWTYKGKKLSYVNARCETGHLQARVEATFKDGTFLSGVFIRPCQVAQVDGGPGI